MLRIPGWCIKCLHPCCVVQGTSCFQNALAVPAAEYMKCVKANPGDVLCLKNLSDGCAEVTLWKKSNQVSPAPGGPPLVQVLHAYLAPGISVRQAALAMSQSEV